MIEKIRNLIGQTTEEDDLNIQALVDESIELQCEIDNLKGTVQSLSKALKSISTCSRCESCASLAKNFLQMNELTEVD